MKHKIQQNQINGLSEAISIISTDGFLRTSGGSISDILTISGDVQAETMVGDGLYMDRINLGGEQSYGSAAINGTGQRLSARLILDSNAATNRPTSYANLMVGGGISFTLNSSNNYPVEGAEIGQMTIATSGEEAIISTEASEFKISKSGLRTNKPIEISNIRIENKFMYLDRRSGLLDQIDPDDYIGADYTIFANTENIGENSSFLQKYSLTYSRRLEREGLNGVIKDQIGITGNPIEVAPVKNGGVIDVYLRNNCFENWRIYALCEKLKHEGFSSASSSMSSNSSSNSSSSNSSSSVSSSSSKSSSSSRSSSSVSSSSSHSSSSVSSSSSHSSSSITWPSEICVRGAGAGGDINGTYTWVDDENGGYYENGLAVLFKDELWHIVYDGDDFYESDYETFTPDTTYHSNGLGVEPNPQVLLGICSSSSSLSSRSSSSSSVSSSSSGSSSSSSKWPDPECEEPEYYSFPMLPKMWSNDPGFCSSIDDEWCVEEAEGIYKSEDNGPPFEYFYHGWVGEFGPDDHNLKPAWMIGMIDNTWWLAVWAFQPWGGQTQPEYTELASFGGGVQTGPYGAGTSDNGYKYTLSYQDPDSYIEITDCEVQSASGIYENVGYGSNGTVLYENENGLMIYFSGTMYCGGKWILADPSGQMMAFWNDAMVDYPEGLVDEAFTVSENTFATIGNSDAE